MDVYKQHKEIESKVHRSLFTNLQLLSHVYPTTDKFDAVLSKDMFVKNNKTAFFEVIYYLLHILDPDNIKTHLKNWPPYDLKREAKFRSEVVFYVNTLNATYKHADIPVCQPSSLISPGGFRFAKFMLKISQLVIYQHLVKSDHIVLQPLRPNKNLPGPSIIRKGHLSSEIRLINNELNELLINFEKYYGDAKEMSKKLLESLEFANKEIYKAKEQLNEAQEDFNAKYPLYPSDESLEQKISELRKQTQNILELEKMFQSIEELLKYLSTSISIEHNEDDLKIPNDVGHIISSLKELNLTEYFEAIGILLEKNTLQLHSPPGKCMEEIKENVDKLTLKFENCLKQMQLQMEELNSIVDNIKQSFRDTRIA